MHEESSSRRKVDEDVQDRAVPAYLLDRETTTRAKVLSNTIKQKRKEKAGKWEVHLPKVEVEKLKSQSQEEGSPTMTEDEMFAIVLGEKPGYICGLGAGPKPKSKQSHDLLEKRAEELAAQVQSLQAQMQTEVQSEVAELKAQMQADMQSQMAALMEQVKKQMQQPPNPLL